jgi:hypothetical protein
MIKKRYFEQFHKIMACKEGNLETDKKKKKKKVAPITRRKGVREDF